MRTAGARRAFTLVELLISFLVFSIILGLGYTLLQRTFFGLDRQKQSLDTMHEARDFLMYIERDLRQMTKLVSLDTVFKEVLFDKENALMYTLVLEIPVRGGEGTTTVTYSYEGPTKYQDLPNIQKVIYRQEAGKVKRALIATQLSFLKIWGTDGTIFRNRDVKETMETYQTYLMPHYYHPSNPAANGLRDLAKVKGVEVQLCMNEIVDKTGKVVKTRTFITRIYSRVLNAKYQ